jgi:hypothetical protein
VPQRSRLLFPLPLEALSSHTLPTDPRPSVQSAQLGLHPAVHSERRGACSHDYCCGGVTVDSRA